MLYELKIKLINIDILYSSYLNRLYKKSYQMTKCAQ